MSIPLRRQPPRLAACMSRSAIEHMRSQALYGLKLLDAKGIRRRKLPLHECLVDELNEAGYTESANYLQDLIYDNVELVEDDEIGLVVDLRKRKDYIEEISSGLMKAEDQRDKNNVMGESIELLTMARQFAEREKGILWLAEKLFLAAIAVASQYLLDGGRTKCICKYHYAKFLLDKFPDADQDEAFEYLTDVRDLSIGKDWPLELNPVVVESSDESVRSVPHVRPSRPGLTVIMAAAVQLHRVLLSKVRNIRSINPAKAERLARLAERRAIDATQEDKVAEAVIEIGVCQLMMNNLNNAFNTLKRAANIFDKNKNYAGLCDTKMHKADVLQKLGKYPEAVKFLSDMGALAMKHNLRRHLGQALHLLGELHLRLNRPELSTEHLKEAFAYFMGFFDTGEPEEDSGEPRVHKGMGVIYQQDDKKKEVFVEEAEHSRFTAAVSAGQENMYSFFDLIRKADQCVVAQTQIIEWKAAKAHWGVARPHLVLIPCMCDHHQRTHLDILRYLKVLECEESDDNSSMTELLRRVDTIADIRTLRSTFYYKMTSIYEPDDNMTLYDVHP